MAMHSLQDYISQIKGLNNEAMAKSRARLDSLVKPPRSLGKLEEIAERLSGISGEMFFDAGKRCIIIMASDNGVVEEGIASAPQVVTLTQTLNFTKGLTGVAVLARQFNADLIIVDVGINADLDHPLVKNRKIRKATWNIAKHEAMTHEEAEKAILVGIETAKEAVKNGYKLLGAGEMGIGNTTTSAAVLCALTGIPVEEATGKGAGLNEESYRRKIEVIKIALSNNRPDKSDPVDVLAKVGGFDIAAMAGVYLGAAFTKTPVVVDGFISMVAALAATRLCPAAKEYMFASHASYEHGFNPAAAAIGFEVPLNLNMRLGEGSGCPLMFAVIDASCAMMREMGTFEEANIGAEYLDKITKGDNFTVNK